MAFLQRVKCQIPSAVDIEGDRVMLREPVTRIKNLSVKICAQTPPDFLAPATKKNREPICSFQL